MAPSSCWRIERCQSVGKGLPLPARSGGPPGRSPPGWQTSATCGSPGRCFTGREAGFIIRSGDGGGARRKSRSPPTVPAQHGTGGRIPMFGCDLTTAGVPAGGTSCRYCRAVPHAARKAGRAMPEPARLARLHLCRAQPAHPTASRLRSLRHCHPPGLPQFLTGPYQAGQLRSARGRLRHYRITARPRGGRNREDRQAPAEAVGCPCTADEVGQWLVNFRVNAPAGIPLAAPAGEPPGARWRGSREPAGKALHTPGHARAQRTSAVHRRRAGHPGRPQIGQE